MKSRVLLRAFTALTISIILLTLAGKARAQDIEGGASRKDLSGGAGNSGRPAGGGIGRTTGGPTGGSRPVTNSPGRRIVRNTAPRTAPRIVTPQTGAISVSAEPNAKLSIDPLGIPGQDGFDSTIPPNERGGSFDDLKPGRYHVKAELEGYTTDERDVIVRKNAIEDVTLNLRPITYNVTVTANIKTGEVRYQPVVESGVDAQGEKIYNPVQGTVASVVSIENYQARLPNLRSGLYGVDIRTEEVGYAKLRGKFNLPGETNINVTLDKKLSEKTLNANWNTFKNTWDTTGNWNSASSGLTVNGPGFAIPHNGDYRYYSDFEMVSDVQLLNGVAVSFVVRAVDEQNYYLIQLTGPSADEPYVLRGFIVRGGNVQRFGEPQPIDVFASTFKGRAPFTVSLKMTDNRIVVQIQDNESSGEMQPAGVLTDPNRQLKVGAVGIGSRGNEQFAVKSFMVCNKECPK